MYLENRAALIKTPFEKDHELHTHSILCSEETQKLPGYPQILLKNRVELSAFLSKDLCAPILEALSPRLWWMSTQSSAHVWPLHHQAVKLRNIIISENPELHLVWYYDRIFIKPLPKYLLSYDFWNIYLIPQTSQLGPGRETIRRSALGFLRTYRYLVQYQSDFDIAMEKKLLPAGTSWETFSAFASDLRRIVDNDVTGRWAYGEIRLSRLNFYIKIVLGKSTFHKVNGQYGTYFSRFYGPVLFIIGLISIILNALQLEMTVEAINSVQWRGIWFISRWTSILAVTIVCWIAGVLFMLLICKIAAEWYHAYRDWRRRNHEGRKESA